MAERRIENRMISYVNSPSFFKIGIEELKKPKNNRPEYTGMGAYQYTGSEIKKSMEGSIDTIIPLVLGKILIFINDYLSDNDLSNTTVLYGERIIFPHFNKYNHNHPVDIILSALYYLSKPRNEEFNNRSHKNATFRKILYIVNALCTNNYIFTGSYKVETFITHILRIKNENRMNEVFIGYYNYFRRFNPRLPKLKEEERLEKLREEEYLENNVIEGGGKPKSKSKSKPKSKSKSKSKPKSKSKSKIYTGPRGGKYIIIKNSKKYLK